MKQRDKLILVRVTETERAILKQKSESAGMTVSQFVRDTLIYSDDCTIQMIDIEPLEKAVYEFAKHGNNLNQFMHFLNTYKHKGFDKKVAEKVMRHETEVLDGISSALMNLRREAKRHKVVLAKSQGTAQREGEDGRKK